LPPSLSGCGISLIVLEAFIGILDSSALNAVAGLAEVFL
jgi:hypothetical protein